MIMEKNNEKELRIYSRPECEVVTIETSNRILDDSQLEPGQPGFDF